jgi:hypothetical protein
MNPTGGAIVPLLDHFHEPIYPRHGWESFHTLWAVSLLEALNRRLPSQRYLAEVQIHVGRRIEADVAEFELPSPVIVDHGNVSSVDIVFPDDIEVEVFDLRQDGKRLVAIIELISPRNKDREEARRAFVAKCAAYLQRGIGLIVVDIVTSRGGNLHHELMEFLGQPQGSVLPAETDLYAVAYHPARCKEINCLDLWPMALTVGQPLPLLPLGLLGAFFVPVDLEATYTEARQRCRL